MSTAAQYAYLDARVSVFAKRLLSIEILSQFVDTAEVTDIMATVLPQAEISDSIATRALEQWLLTMLVAESEVLARSLTGPAHDLVSFWLRRFEIVNLKIILRTKMAEMPVDDIRAQLLDLGGMAALPLKELLHTETVAELLRVLEQSAYAAMAQQARISYEEKHDLFSVEAILDREYFSGLSKRVNALPEADSRYLRRLIGTLIDQMNLLWLLRYRHIYGLTPAHTYFLLIPSGHYLDNKCLLALVQHGSVEEAVANLPIVLREVLSGAATIDAIETRLKHHTEYVARIVLTRTTFNLGRPCAYLLLRECQLWQIHAIVKGKQAKLAPELIRRAIGLFAANTIAGNPAHV